jgi:single-strand DNA-binding protein
MASYNKVILLGNLTRVPELRHITSGMAVTDIGLAVNDVRKGTNGEKIEEVTFVDITLWGRNAEIAAEYLTKGSPVLVEGRLKLDTWDADGQKRSKLKVVGEKLQLVGSRNDSQRGSGGSYSQPPQRPQQNSQPPVEAYDDFGGGDDVPF